MKKILKSELTPQLVKHQEATLQLLIVQGDSFTHVLPASAQTPSDSLHTSPVPSVRPSDHEN